MQSSRVLPFSYGLLCAALAVACGGGGGGARRQWRGWAGRRRRTSSASPAATRAPWVTTGTAAVTLTVDAATTGAAWSRFYEGAVATDHANTILSSALGTERADRAQEGARRGRLPLRALPRHPEPRHRRLSGRPRRRWRPTRPPTTGRASIRCTTRSWRRACARSSRSASRRPRSRRTPAQIQTQLWYGGVSPNISKPIRRPPPTDGDADLGPLAEVHGRHRHATSRTATAPTRSATTGTSRSGTRRPGCTGPARPATTSSTTTPRSA